MEYNFPIFSVVGESDSGKTKLICKLIDELTGKGHEVASLKHTRGDFTIDSKDKDTWNHAEAGSKLVVFSAKNETDFIFKEKLQTDDLISHIESFGNYDVVLIEGMRDQEFPKIATGNYHDNDVIFDYDGNIDEIISHMEKKIRVKKILKELPGLDCKKCGYESCEELAENIYEGKNNLEDCKSEIEEKYIRLKVDGKKIDLNKFPSEFIEKTVKGMVKSLKGVDKKDLESIEIKINGDECK